MAMAQFLKLWTAGGVTCPAGFVGEVGVGEDRRLLSREFGKIHPIRELKDDKVVSTMEESGGQRAYRQPPRNLGGWRKKGGGRGN